MVLRSSHKAFTGLVLALLCAPVWAVDGEPDHKIAEAAAPAVAAPANAQNTPAPNREQLLVDGLKNANLDPKGLAALERAFADNPRIAPGDFNATLDKLIGRGELQPGQANDLKQLFNQTLKAPNAEPGKELALAARKLLKDDKAPGAEKDGEKKKDGAVPALDPQMEAALNAKLAQMNGGLPGGAPQGGGLMQNLMLGKLMEMLGGDKDKDDKGAGNQQMPPPMTPPMRGGGGNRDEGRDRKKETPKETGDKGRGMMGGMMPQQPSSSDKKDDDKKEDKKPAPSSSSSDSSKKKFDDKEDDKKDDPSKVADANSSLLDSLKNGSNAPDPGPKRPLPPMPPNGMGPFGLPGGPGMGGMPGGGPGLGGGGGMGMGMGGMGGGGGFGGGSMSGDVFSGIGAGGFAGMMGGAAGGSGFSIVREGGYAGANGGGANGGGDSEGGTEGDYTPSAGPSRLATLEVGAATPVRSEGLSLVEKFVGFAGKRLCTTEENQKDVGFCEGLALRQNRQQFSRRLGADF